ncbi:MAG: hypothetical protein EXX96DRAFT_617090 [Benjaminiella poitrasii]|nr:MAG: hypothetical protein EXX96DRAFT_617090 [Benjaminiella poitrasii]
MKQLQHKWCMETYAKGNNNNRHIIVTPEHAEKYSTPLIASNIASSPVSTILPFHTFACPLTVRQIQKQWAASLQISTTIHCPICYKSVLGFHDKAKYDVYCYAATPSDNSPYSQKIVLVESTGARNEVFTARRCPVQCSFMGFEGTLGGGDWIIADPIVCPTDIASGEVWLRRGSVQDAATAHFIWDVDPEDAAQDDFVYTEKFIYMPHSYSVDDHKQGFKEDDHGQALLPHHHGEIF